MSEERSNAGDLIGPFANSGDVAVLARAMHEPLPNPIADTFDPYKTPEAFLPWLAAHHSVDLWFDDWDVATKREMVAQSKGVSTLYPGEPLAELKGTFEGLKRYLWFVDATVEDRLAYPARFVLGRSAIGITPLQHPAFQARYLIKVTLKKPLNAWVLGRSALGQTATRKVDQTPVLRAKLAARIAKAEHVEYRVSFAWRRRARMSDGLPMDGNLAASHFIPKNHIND